MNDTIKENGLVQSRLVFGTVPRFPTLNKNVPEQKKNQQQLKLHKQKWMQLWLKDDYKKHYRK